VDWPIIDFFALVVGSIFVYGVAELALPTEDFEKIHYLYCNSLALLRYLEHGRLGRVLHDVDIGVDPVSLVIISQKLQ
jgi:hypothetical protein